MVVESVNPAHSRASMSRPARRPRGKHTAPGTTGRWIREGGFIVVVALSLAVLLRLFVVQTFFIPSGSMEPTLQIGDRILVNKLSYHLHSVHRGDIVVFKRPADENCGGDAGQRSGEAGHRASRRDHFVDQGCTELRHDQRQATERAVAPLVRTGRDLPGSSRHELQPREAVRDSGQRLLRHG